MFTYIIFFDKKLLNSCYILLQSIIINKTGAITMIYKRIKNFLMIGFVLAISACGSKEPLILEEPTPPAEAAPEQVKGKIDVYNSMARAVKYNINTTIYNMKNKVDNITPQTSAQSLINSVYSGDETNLSDALHLLDFAIIFATNAIEDNAILKDEYLFEKSAQHLSLAAIRTHEDTLFANKKLRHIDRIAKLETKNVDALNNKLAKNGKLSDSEIAYKKGLEVALHDQNQIRNQIISNVTQYLRLTQGDEKKLDLEGRHFYELEDFDQKYTLSAFQRTASENRKELTRAKQKGYNTDYQSLLHNIMRNYPEMEHLHINGADINDEPYIRGLVKRARKVSENLIKSALKYRNNNIEVRRPSLRNKVLANLGDAIFAQIELAYNLIEQQSIQLASLQEEIAKQRKEIRNKEKNIKASNPAKIEVMNLKNKLLALELQESKLIAERAATLRSLYFYAGFSPFSKILLEQRIKMISDNLKIAFNQDMISMISNSPDIQPQQKDWEVKDEDWAKGENWLEQLVDERKQLGKNALDGHVSENTRITTNIESHNNKVTSDYNQRKILQLGAYLQKESADLEWKMLRHIYPELQNQTPKIEETTIDGKIWYRLYIESANGGWLDLCNRLKKDNFGCILR